MLRPTPFWKGITVLSRRALLATALAGTACLSDKATTPTGITGTASFTYSGAISGTFNASGQMPINGSEWETASFAIGEVSVADDASGVIGFMPRTSTSHDNLLLGADRATTGTVSLDNSCTGTNACGFAAMTFGQVNGGSSTVLFDCYLTAGSITITTISAARVVGTFSGTGECLPGGSGSAQAFAVTNGAFDVPRVALP